MKSIEVKEDLEPKLIRKLRYKINDAVWNLKRSTSPNSINEFVLIDKSRFLYPLDSGIGHMLYCGNFEVKEINFIRRTLRPGDIVLDIGANGGIYSIIASKCVGSTGHVYAFEPSSREVELLQRNIEQNSLKNVTIIERAVGDNTTDVRFAIAKDGGLNALVDNKRPDQKIEKWEYVPMISIDEFMNEFSLDHIDFIKVDVEGAEHLVFKGAKKLLKSRKAITILFEASNVNAVNYGYTVNDLFKQLLEWGLELYYLDKNGGLQPISDIHASFGYQIYNFVAKV